MSSWLRTALRIFHPIAILRLVGVVLCIFSYSRNTLGIFDFVEYGVNLFQFRFNTNLDLSLYYTTAVGFGLLLVLNYKIKQHLFCKSGRFIKCLP